MTAGINNMKRLSSCLRGAGHGEADGWVINQFLKYVFLFFDLINEES